ncbi:hypothetical protein DSOL_4981 [Desulfosporosinus metallidurans]|uniref:Uncharacterized protein n=1 Tax=Desulfosporosinus metallidurans TaxID=1888891 RepID=A0A1Q8QGG8_9FIRM|nr:hypothetical protein DSOL_4981 [Desulfosporosinus metallidurans]
MIVNPRFAFIQVPKIVCHQIFIYFIVIGKLRRYFTMPAFIHDLRIAKIAVHTGIQFFFAWFILFMGDGRSILVCNEHFIDLIGDVEISDFVRKAFLLDRRRIFAFVNKNFNDVGNGMPGYVCIVVPEKKRHPVHAAVSGFQQHIRLIFRVAIVLVNFGQGDRLVFKKHVGCEKLLNFFIHFNGVEIGAF